MSVLVWILLAIIILAIYFYMTKPETVKINFNEDISHYPGGILEAEDFKQNHLLPNLNTGKKIILNIDGVNGFGSSFLKVAFTGLGDPKKIRKQLTIISKEDSSYLIEIWDYINGKY